MGNFFIFTFLRKNQFEKKMNRKYKVYFFGGADSGFNGA